MKNLINNKKYHPGDLILYFTVIIVFIICTLDVDLQCRCSENNTASSESYIYSSSDGSFDIDDSDISIFAVIRKINSKKSNSKNGPGSRTILEFVTAYLVYILVIGCGYLYLIIFKDLKSTNHIIISYIKNKDGIKL
ncbi:MAG: hypothetical protein K6B68_10100 [Eubacterium sp.]|nr:hypothetical protein [Eubacterium sp.]